MKSEIKCIFLRPKPVTMYMIARYCVAQLHAASLHILCVHGMVHAKVHVGRCMWGVHMSWAVWYHVGVEMLMRIGSSMQGRCIGSCTQGRARGACDHEWGRSRTQDGLVAWCRGCRSMRMCSRRRGGARGIMDAGRHACTHARRAGRLGS